MDGGMIIFWTVFIGTCICFVYCGYYYLKKNGLIKTIIPIFGVNLILFLFYTLSSDLIGKGSQFDLALEFIHTTAFFLAPTLITLVYTINSKGLDNLLDNNKSLGG